MQATADQTAPRPPRRRGELRLKLFDCHNDVNQALRNAKRCPALCVSIMLGFVIALSIAHHNVLFWRYPVQQLQTFAYSSIVSGLS